MANNIAVELENLKQRILLLGTTVEHNLDDALRAALSKDLQLAAQVRKNDREINEIEVGVEDDCLSILALNQPVARDLRFIVTVLKINIDLERIGDLAVTIACKVPNLSGKDPGYLFNPEIPVEVMMELKSMCTGTVRMLGMGLDAFAREDSDLAYKVIQNDNKVDTAKNLIGSCLEKNLRENPTGQQHLATLLSVSRSLERVADHTTNICEDIIYMLQGRVIRHRLGEQLAPAGENSLDIKQGSVG
ncbi:MAG: phosphate signaling complex protein PhoU [Desulfobulbales bacterium]|nr:phosphate signaling complex protein PhoU [Desulfobulbales bacterium]